MTQVVTDDQQRMDYLNRVLQINPDNELAQKGREIIEERLLGNMEAEHLLQEARDRLDSGNQHVAARVSQANGPEESNGTSRRKSSKNSGRFLLFLLLIAVIVFAGGGLILWSLLESSGSQEPSASESPEPFVRYEIVGVYRASSVSYGDEQAEAAGEFVIVSINASDYGDVPAELSFSSFELMAGNPPTPIRPHEAATRIVNTMAGTDSNLIRSGRNVSGFRAKPGVVTQQLLAYDAPTEAFGLSLSIKGAVFDLGIQDVRTVALLPTPTATVTPTPTSTRTPTPTRRPTPTRISFGTRSASTRPTVARPLQAGARGVLRTPDNSPSPIWVSEDAMSHAADAARIDDTIGMFEGLLFFVPSGTKVLVIDRDWMGGYTEVRFMDGERFGRSGWTWSTWIVSE